VGKGSSATALSGAFITPQFLLVGIPYQAPMLAPIKKATSAKANAQSFRRGRRGLSIFN